MSNVVPNLVSVHCVTKSYPMGEGRLEVLRGVDLEIKQGEAVSIVGSSGAGKSTLLHILGTLDRPTLGKVVFKGVDLTRESDERLAQFRNHSMGFVFQFHHLMSEFSALENVMMPGRIGGQSIKEARHESERLLDQLGLSQRLNHYPSEMSGGEQQRVAIARALVRKPEILFADEPTGNLDAATGAGIIELLLGLARQDARTFVAVTHDPALAALGDRQLHLREGRLVEQTR